MNPRCWVLGPEGEALVRRWLKEQGFLVVPASLIDTGGAPMLEGWLKDFVLPDNQAFRNGDGRWVEVKTKSRASYYKKTRQWEHGVKLQNWKDYLEVQRNTSMPAWIAVVELESGLVLLAQADVLKLKARFYLGTAMPGGKPHVFFPRDAFEWYAEPRTILIKPIEPKAVRTLQQGKAPTVRQLSML